MNPIDHLINGVIISAIVFSLNSFQQKYSSRREDIRRLVDLTLAEISSLESELYPYLNRKSKIENQKITEDLILRKVLRLRDLASALSFFKCRTIKDLKPPEDHCDDLYDIATGGGFQSSQSNPDRLRAKKARDCISRLRKSLYVC